MAPLQKMITLRPATSADQARIVAHIRAAQINPLDLKWQHFTLAEDDASGMLVGTGQIKTHGDGSRELASIAVAPAWQGQGVARRLIEHLLAQNTGTLFLTCRSPLGPLYAKFGFRAVGESEMTPYFRRLMKVARVLRPLMSRGGTSITLLVMKRDG
jgi:N-acetylglutamate synthase-like GNAT family acetyltransferase